MNSSRPRTAYILAMYALITVVMTWPQAIRLGSGSRDWGDPLLNAWIMWWEVDAVTSGNLTGFFDANIFFPHSRTLAYSEFLIPQTLLGAPFLLLFDNPLIAYNLVLLASFVITAWAMYVLGEYLTGSWFAGFVAGLALAFSPFMFGHLSHIQVIAAAGFPLAFYALHRYFEERTVGYLLLFTLAYAGQALANAYFGLYLTYAAGAYIVYRAIRDRLLTDAAFYRHMALHAALSIVLLAPFYGQYWMLRHELAFTRDTVYLGGWYSFLSAPGINRLWGGLTAPMRAGEGALFPGLLVTLLAVAGIVASILPRRSADDPVPPAAVGTYRFLGVLIVLAWVIVLAISLTGGFSTTVIGIGIRANDFQNPIIGFVVGVAGRAVLRRRHPGIGRGGPWFGNPQRFYAGMLFVSVFLTLGPDGLYGQLYDHAPGFDAVRAVARIHIVSVFCLAVFVAYGVRHVSDRFLQQRPVWVAAILPLVLLIELFSAPVPMHDVAWGDDAPEIYHWLREQEDAAAVIVYPLDLRLEFDRLFYSPIHRRNLVNGFSGYLAPVYREMQSREAYFPSVETVADIRSLGVRWVLVQPDRYEHLWPRVEADLRDLRGELRPVAEIGDMLVFEVVDAEARSREELYEVAQPVSDDSGWIALPRDDWTLSANTFPQDVDLAADGDLETRWHSGIQKQGDELMVDFGSNVTVGRVALHLGRFPHDYPRGYRVDVAADGEAWREVERDLRLHWPILDFLEPLGHSLTISFAPTQARYLRVVQTANDNTYVWTVAELEVFAPLR